MCESRLDIPQLRVCPVEVLRDLRLIVPTAELVYMGEGMWLLGSVERTNLRERAGRYKIQRARSAQIRSRRDLARWRYVAWEGELLTQGFAPIKVFEGDPDSRIVEYLREREYNWARDLDDAWKRVVYDRDDDEDAELDALHTSLVDEKRLMEAYRWGFKRPVSIIKPEPKKEQVA